MGSRSENAAALEGFQVGTYIKVRGENGKFKRVEVVEVADGGEVPIKVRMSDKKKPKDVWMKLDDCRFIRQISVNWDGIEAKLPIDQDPESRVKRKAVFADWTQGRKKTLSLEELQRGVREYLGAEFGADVEETEIAVKNAWKVARNLAPPKKKNQAKAAKTVDAKEFHAFIVALRYYVELAELFEHLDAQQEDDQKLSHRECRKDMASLEAWGISEEKLAEKFKGLDLWTPAVVFEDFAKWCVEERWSSMNLGMELDSSDDEVQLASAGANLRASVGISREDKRYGQECLHNRKKVMEIFVSADVNKSGTISEEELVEVFSKLESGISKEAARKLFRLADSNQDGQVDYEEFCLWLFR
mmetsp:Transcript_6924/g.16513  ORF Transcript_6924/g.16513 Transcript_6924/m.16513 type:complete len:359 (-) Transcript_6924:90-1166(-)